MSYRATELLKYSQVLLYGHPLNTDTSLLQIVCLVPRERSLYILSKFSPLKVSVKENEVPTEKKF